MTSQKQDVQARFRPFVCMGFPVSKWAPNGLWGSFFFQKWTKWANFWPVGRYG